MATKKQSNDTTKEAIAFIKEVGIGPALVQRLGEFNGLMARVLQQEQAITKLIGTVVSPEKALTELTGELRAIRQMMDKDGKYAFMDKPKST